VTAGSRGGTVKVWDLSQEKRKLIGEEMSMPANIAHIHISPTSLTCHSIVVRTLTGHRASVRCLDFHPYGDYFASGSLDTNIKIFDVRKPNCMQTYRGHGTGITCLKHSPDGRWIVSGDGDGVVKVWDLTSGKALNEFRILRKGT